MPDPTVGTAAAADQPLGNTRMRASDADRHATVEVLQNAVVRGLLTPAEGSDRMGAAFAAVHLDDLEPITADIPQAALPRRRRGGARCCSWCWSNCRRQFAAPSPGGAGRPSWEQRC